MESKKKSARHREFRFRAIAVYLLLATAQPGGGAFAYSLDGLTISGKDRAEIVFSMKHAEESVPQIKVQDNVVEVTFLGGELGKDLLKKDWTGVHPLVQSVHFSAEGDHSIKARLVISGTTESLKSRVKLEKNATNVRLTVEFPAVATESSVATAAADWREAEQLPIGSLEAKPEKNKTASQSLFTALVVLLILVTAGTAFWFLRRAKIGGLKRGSRKYLIEQMAFHSMGNRSGVGLLKVGSEFVLVGVTPQSITMLSTLPDLKVRYQEETQFEREDFKVAVEEELGRLKSRKLPRATA